MNNFLIITRVNGNPDHMEDPSKPPFGFAEEYSFRGLSIDIVIRQYLNFIHDIPLGAGNLTSYLYNSKGEKISKVAYNGRLILCEEA